MHSMFGVSWSLIDEFLPRFNRYIQLNKIFDKFIALEMELVLKKFKF